MPIKVLNLIDSLDVGGAEVLLKNFALEAKKYNEFDIEICTLYSSGIFGEEIRKVEIPLYNLKLRFKYDPRGVSKLVGLIKEKKYDIVHVHLFPANVFAALSSFFLPKNVEFIFTEHGAYNRRRSSSIIKPFDILTYNRYSNIICVSKQVQSELIEWLPKVKERTVVIPNGIPVPEWINGQPSKQYDIFFAGRLEKDKRVDILFKAINILKTQYNKAVKVAIVGDGSLKKELKKLAKKLQIENKIKFLGIRKDIDKIMFSSKILVLSSKWEGLPMVILEAMSRKLPVIATAVGGIPDVIKDGKEGILVPPKNPKILAEAMVKLLEDEKLQKTLSQNAYKKVKERYTIEIYTKDILNLYKSLIQNY